MSLLTDLVSYWKMDESSGDAIDVHGGNTLVDTGSVASGAGVINTSREFSGAGTDYFSKASNASLQTGDIDFTWAFWAYRDTDTIKRVFVKGTTNSEYNCLFDGGASRYLFAVWTGAGQTGIASVELTTLLGTAAWHFIVCWHDSVANTINIQGNNGTVYSTAHTGGVHVDTQDFFCGILDSGGSHPWDGRLDEIGFWKRVLTADERTQLYNGGAGFGYPFPRKFVLH